jgi:hydrogenase large subunit
MEVGPLASTLVAYISGSKSVKALVDTVLAAVGQAGHPEVLMSNLGRLAGRVIHAKESIDHALGWSDDLVANIKGGDMEYFINKPVPDSGEGFGGWDAPRGALCHYIRIGGGKVSSYAPVPASNWNLAPRNDKGVRGPVEEALIGTPVAVIDQPLEVLRTVHTFDP